MIENIDSFFAAKATNSFFLMKDQMSDNIRALIRN
jgi:hypothetical protein